MALYKRVTQMLKQYISFPGDEAEAQDADANVHTQDLVHVPQKETEKRRDRAVIPETRIIPSPDQHPVQPALQPDHHLDQLRDLHLRKTNTEKKRNRTREAEVLHLSRIVNILVFECYV